jgi:hypothetical protein
MRSILYQLLYSMDSLHMTEDGLQIQRVRAREVGTTKGFGTPFVVPTSLALTRCICKPSSVIYLLMKPGYCSVMTRYMATETETELER